MSALLCVAMVGAACGSDSPNTAAQVPGDAASRSEDDAPEPPSGVEQPDAVVPAGTDPDSSASSPVEQPEAAGGQTEEADPDPDADSPAPTDGDRRDAEHSGRVGEPASGSDASEPDDPRGNADLDAQTSGAAATRILPPVFADAGGVQRWTVEVIESFPHDPEAFTQGLEVSGGVMYESTGLWGRSSLRTVDPATGEVTARTDLSEAYFGEGLTVVADRVVQLTWQSETAFVYDRATLSVVAQHSYEGEGWGLCLSGETLIMSNGSDQLTRRDPQSFEPLGTVTVNAAAYDGRLDYLNELECVEDLVIANVWQTDRLLVIDPATGRVAAEIDASPLVADAVANSSQDSIDVLNGVAVDERTRTLWMTGKLWPRLYRVRVVEAS